MFLPKQRFCFFKQQHRHYSTEQTNLYIKPFEFYTYEGNLLNLKVNEKFKSYHIITTEDRYKFNQVANFIEVMIDTQNKINGKNIMVEKSFNLYACEHPLWIKNPIKTVFFTSGVYNNGEKNCDAIIIHSEDEKNKEFDWFITNKIFYFFHIGSL